MSDNPFEPPQSDLAPTQRNLSRASVAKAVAIGATVDIVGSIILGVGVLAAYLALHMTPDMTPDDWMTILERFQHDTADFRSVWMIAGVSLGLAMSILGGYVCARIAKAKWRQAVWVLAMIMVLFGVITTVQHYPLTLTLLLSLAAVPAIFIGGWLYSVGQQEAIGLS